MGSVIFPLPELIQLMNGADLWQHTLNTVSNAPQELTSRWAALLLDVAKVGLAERSSGDGGKLLDQDDMARADLTDQVMRRFGFSKKVRERVVWLVEQQLRLPRLGFEEKQLFSHWLRDAARCREVSQQPSIG